MMHTARIAKIATVLALLASPAWAATGLFGTLEIKANTIASIPKWVDALKRIRAEDMEAQCRTGQCSGARQDWSEMVQSLRGRSRFEQMVEVHRWHNRYRYITDDRLWGRSDYWSTPGEFVDMSGDCEDYSIAKYYTLRALGWSDEDLRIVILRDTVRDIAHAVLAVKYNNENYILDNLASEPLQDKYIRQYTPYYAVNGTTRWVFIRPME
jgi:predicted transglutaminase-like cysteine proteinase